jgi:hypothetical protein
MPDDQGFYLAEPAGPEPAGGSGGPEARPAAGVAVVHDWYGQLPHVRASCDELAAAGLAARARVDGAAEAWSITVRFLRQHLPGAAAG